MPHASFDGRRVLSLESRRAREVEKLIRTYNGDSLVVPAMRELPLSTNTACLEFGRGLLRGEFDLVIFLTGVGVNKMIEVLSTELDREEVLAALRQLKVVVRGVKPQSALRELNVPIVATVGEPSTWRELLALLTSTFGEELGNFRVAVQEYGATNPEMIAALVERSASVTKVPVYQWGLPLDLEPLRDSVRAVVDGKIDIVLFMTAVQVIHLFQVAEQMQQAEQLRRALRRIAVVSVGPSTTEELRHYGVRPDFEPSRPRMGFLVNEAAQYAAKVLAEKRMPATSGDDREATLGDGEQSAPQPGQVRQVASSTATMAGFRDNLAPFDVIQETETNSVSGDPLHDALSRIVRFVSTLVPCDSCFLYTLEGDELVLRASSNPRPEVLDTFRITMGQGVTGWVAQHREPVAIFERASDDPRFLTFANLPEDRFEAILCVPVMCANRLVGVLNVQHREPYLYTDSQRGVLATAGILLGAEIERARLESEKSKPV